MNKPTSSCGKSVGKINKIQSLFLGADTNTQSMIKQYKECHVAIHNYSFHRSQRYKQEGFLLVICVTQRNGFFTMSSKGLKERCTGLNIGIDSSGSRNIHKYESS